MQTGWEKGADGRKYDIEGKVQLRKQRTETWWIDLNYSINNPKQEEKNKKLFFDDNMDSGCFMLPETVSILTTQWIDRNQG
jgi:hypothetical protein